MNQAELDKQVVKKKLAQLGTPAVKDSFLNLFRDTDEILVVSLGDTLQLLLKLNLVKLYENNKILYSNNWIGDGVEVKLTRFGRIARDMLKP